MHVHEIMVTEQSLDKIRRQTLNAFQIKPFLRGIEVNLLSIHSTREPKRDIILAALIQPGDIRFWKSYQAILKEISSLENAKHRQ